MHRTEDNQMLSFLQLTIQELCLQTVMRLWQLMHNLGVQRELNPNICSARHIR